MDCVNLKEQFGNRFRVESEDGNVHNADPWLWVMRCSNGHIFVHGGSRLGAATDKRGPAIRKLLAISSAQLEQDGDDGVNVSFDVTDFHSVAEILKPRRRRRLTPEQRAKLNEASRNTRFKPGAQRPENGPGASEAA